MPDPGNRRLDSAERQRLSVPLDAPHSVEPVDEIPPQEPLFNKRVMILWALGAFLVWLGITRIVPIAKHAAKEAIVESIKQAQEKSARTITIHKNGEVITITRSPEPAGPAASSSAGEPKSATVPGSSGSKVVVPSPPEIPKPPAKR